MIILIDGYNILRYLYPDAVTTTEQRQQFLNILTAYARKKKHTIIVIFDGGSWPRPVKETYKDMSIVYSGTQATADDIIKKYIEQNQGEKTVITSDRALRKWVEEHGVVTIEAPAFYYFLQKEMAAKPLARKTHAHAKKYHETSPDLDDLMQQATGKMLFKRDDILIKQEPVLKKLSKQEKKVSKVVKKL